MQKAITQVKLEDLKITVGGSGKSLGTAFFGTLTNETNKSISILTLKIDFLDEDGEVSKTHDFLCWFQQGESLSKTFWKIP